MLTISNKPPSMEMLEKEMISIDKTPVSHKNHTLKNITLSSPPLPTKPLATVGEFILESQGQGDVHTIDAKTVFSKDLSYNSGENKSEHESMIIKPKPIPRKSNFSSPESGKKPISLFNNQLISPVKVPTFEPPSLGKLPEAQAKQGSSSPKKLASKMNAVLNAVNHVHHPSFNFDRFKNFLFSRPIKNKQGFIKFLEEVKNDVDVIKMIAMKEPSPTKVTLRQINKSRIY